MTTQPTQQPMDTIEKLTVLAQSRAQINGLAYLGALTPQEAHTLWTQSTGNAVVLVDVRTQAELDLVGRVPNAMHIEWAFYPSMAPNPDFAEALKSRIDKAATVIFMCRTGARSHNAATLATTLGFKNAINMAEGFEGEANAQQQRTRINGWKHADLPWTN